ncbi:hypothetical protein DP939_35740 [Spongiactinospora rosea]|uniref:DUF4352 domain-containing protein n=1 Tax=Spongiactinospora rosea TaxID=2248750 RepID=A0A366LQ46_9ACTN|nr:hypothetical protein DP939_35740 [Spongiactinospora rosea]
MLDIDLGELVPGHRVVARGLELAAEGAMLHYEFVPGIDHEEEQSKGLFFWYWTLSASDDAGTEYAGNDSGAFASGGGEATHGVRDLGGAVPGTADRLLLGFAPAEGWSPPALWCRQVEVALP